MAKPVDPPKPEHPPHPEPPPRPDPGQGRPYFFFVDGVRVEWPTSSITGGQIRSTNPNLDPTYLLYQELPGNEPDVQVTDTMSFDLGQTGAPLRFYTVPPATFGARA